MGVPNTANMVAPARSRSLFIFQKRSFNEPVSQEVKGFGRRDIDSGLSGRLAAQPKHCDKATFKLTIRKLSENENCGTPLEKLLDEVRVLVDYAVL
ncbi:hypothetical protein J6590_038816 [Homalodisca vitripennis]|nr:hypothetical protein J6590_038816 [Homalodisca vitripennis]